MSKGLEALKTIRHIHDMECGEDESINKDFDIIEKELKALEIIKEKASIDLLEELNDDEPYWLDISCSTKLSQEEYDLLKEVLL